MLEEQGVYLAQDIELLREKLEKVPDSDKKALLLFLDAMIMRAEADVSSLKADVSSLKADVSSLNGNIKLIEHRAETLKMMKQAIEKT